MRTQIVAAVLFAALSVPASAAGILYDCDITNRMKDVGWISPKLAIIVNDSGKVQVIDSVILNFIEEPIDANARTNGDRMRLNWTLSGIYDSANQRVPNFAFQAVLNTKTKAVSLKASPVGFPQSWSGKGSCKTRRSK